MASKVSATVTIRACSGISSPLRPSGYPPPLYFSWWRVPRGSERGGDPAAGADRDGGGHLRRHDHNATLPAGDGNRLRRRHDPALRGRALRPAGRRGVRASPREGGSGHDPGAPGPRRAGRASPGGGAVNKVRSVTLLVCTLLVASRCSSGASKTRTSAEVLLNERMAAVLLREGRAQEAEVAYRDVIRSDPKNPDLRDGLGVALLAQGRVRDALDEFDRAVKLDPGKGLYRIHRGMARTQAGRYGEAEEDFRVADSSSSVEDRLDVAINRGRMRQRMGDYAGAEMEFTAAIAREPKSFDALLGRGVARESRREFAAAAEY